MVSRSFGANECRMLRFPSPLKCSLIPPNTVLLHRYLKNVYPELKLPTNVHGYIRQANRCLDTLGAVSDGSTIHVYPCHYLGGNQDFRLAKNQLLMIHDM